MTPILSLNTQAILLLTAPLIAGRSTASHDLLSPGEYKRLARHLREIQRQPADLVSPDAAEILRACQPVIDESRLHKLLGRGFLLSQVIEQWQARAIWVVSRADAEYPRRLKVRLREDAPAVLYGCGDMSLLETGGLAVVGSRHVDDVLIDYTMSIGRLAARAGSALVSGGARGIDQAAMRGALEAGGKVCGVLADSLEKTAMNRDHRNLLLDGQLVLVSPYDPSAGFNVGNAMQRNKLIYALADAALVVSSDLKKGGTWTGAVEQLNKFKFVPVFTRSTRGASVAIDALVQQGAIPWPNPSDADGLREVFKVSCSADGDSSQSGSSLFDALEDDMSLASEQIQSPLAIQEDKAIPYGYSSSLSQSSGSCAREQAEPMGDLQPAKSLNATPAELLLEAVQACIQQLLTAPMNEVEVATALNVSTSQAKTWLQRLVDEGVIEKRKRPVVYVLKTQRLFD